MTISKKEFFWAISIIALLLLFFNSMSIFYLQTSYLDDFHRYMLGLEFKVHPVIMARNFLRAYIILPLFWLMTKELWIARLVLVVVFYIPLSFTFFYIYRSFFKFPFMFAITASILPCFLPGQSQIPWFIDGSYTVQGLLIFNFHLILALKLIEEAKPRYSLLILSILFYVLSIEMMDQSLFLAPVSLLVGIVGIYKNKKNRVRLIIYMTLVLLFTVLKLVILKINPTVPAAAPVPFNFELFITRLESAIHVMLPFDHTITGDNILSYQLWLVLLVISSLWGFIKGSAKEKILFIGGWAWFFCSIIIFITVSRFYSPRYTHVSAFGLNFLIVLTALVLSRYHVMSGKKEKTLVTLSLIFTVLYAGSLRLKFDYQAFKKRNISVERLTATLNSITFPTSSQIYIANGERFDTGGYWNYSSGFLKLITKRKDLVGLVGPERKMYNPFETKNRGFSEDAKMNGLDPNKPVFFFKEVCKDSNCEYQPKDMVLKVSENWWEILQFDLKDGEKKIRFSGMGIESLENTILKNKIQDLLFY